MMKFFPRSSKRKSYPVVGRDSKIDLKVYGKEVNGRVVIDYEKLKNLNPELYTKVLANERESYLNDTLTLD